MPKALQRDNYFESNKRMKEKRVGKIGPRHKTFLDNGRIFSNDLLNVDYTSQRPSARYAK